MQKPGREKDGTLYGIYRAGGRDFPVYYAYCEDIGYSMPQFPDFEQSPEYDSKGRPFASAPQEGCKHAQSPVDGEEFAGDCGGCRFFEREERTSLLGVCICAARQKHLSPDCNSPPPGSTASTA